MANKDSVQSVFLDTTFLDVLLNNERPEHSVALKYFTHWVNGGVLVATSTICLAEYMAHASVMHEVFKRILIVPFNAEAAILAGELFQKYKAPTVKAVRELEGEHRGLRDALKDDFKIVAAAAVFRAAAVAHNDKSTMERFLQCAQKEFAQCRGLKSVLLSDGFNSGTANFSVPELSFD